MGLERKKRLAGVCFILLCLGAALALLLLLRPPCLILRATGFYCAGCGGIRMFFDLLGGDVSGAFWRNPFLFLVLPPAGIYAAVEAARYVKGRPPLWRRKPVKICLLGVIVAAAGFTAARNLPGFEFLLPR